MRPALAAALALLAAGVAYLPGAAQQAAVANAVLLVAQPGLPDPNFTRAVVLATRTEDGQTIGVVLNRPAPAQGESRQPWFGGPVLPRSVVALFASTSAPPEAALPVLPGVYLTMHPRNIEALRAAPAARYRLFAGFAAWAPEQLERELAAEAWYVLPAEEALLFRNDTRTLWDELVTRARGART